MRTPLPTYSCFIALAGLLSACVQPTPASTTEQSDSITKTAIASQPPKKIIPPYTPEEMKILEDNLFNCGAHASIKFDDNVSDATTIARIVAVVCKEQFNQILRITMVGKEEREYERFLYKGAEEARQNGALQIVLTTRNYKREHPELTSKAGK